MKICYTCDTILIQFAFSQWRDILNDRMVVYDRIHCRCRSVTWPALARASNSRLGKTLLLSSASELSNRSGADLRRVAERNLGLEMRLETHAHP